MEPDNSQFSEVPSEEAAAAATPKARKPRKSRAVQAPVDVAAPAEETQEDTGPEVGGWAAALVRKGSKNAEDKAVAEVAKIAQRYNANKRRHGVQTGSADVDTETVLPKASPAVEHAAGSHGPLSGKTAASLEELMTLSRSDASRLHENADECPTCAENHKNYIESALPELHTNGAHNDAPGSKVLGENMHPECPGCQDKITTIATDGHKKAKHTKFGSAMRLLLGRSGCVQCGERHEAKVAEEHIAGEHAGGVENRRPSCKACQEVSAKEDEAEATNIGLRGMIANARIQRRAELRETAITGRFPPTTPPAVITGDPLPGGLLRTHTPGVPGSKYERVPHYIDDPSILVESAARGKAYHAKRKEAEAAEQSMWDDYLPGRPNYMGLALPSVEEKPATSKAPGHTAGATDEEIDAFEGDATTEGTRKYIPEGLRRGFKPPQEIPVRKSEKLGTPEEFKGKLAEIAEKYPNEADETAEPVNKIHSPEPEAPPSAEQKMWDDYMTTNGRTAKTNLGYPTKGVQNCKSCGKMVSPVAGTINPSTGTVPEVTCKGCARVAAQGITPYISAAHDRGDHEGNSFDNCPKCQEQ